MQAALLEWRKYKYFPYERDFAKLEAKALFGAPATEVELGLTVPAASFRAELAERLTYSARASLPSAKQVVIPRQARLEATASSSDSERQATRYSAHGMHEYKGKFNPQIVRAIGNILGLRDGAKVVDPFCGSGTTLLECAHSGWDAIGIDRNPLAVRIANAKTHALRSRDGRLEEAADAIAMELHAIEAPLARPSGVSASVAAKILGSRWLSGLPSSPYLAGWFPLGVLAQLAAVLRAVRRSLPLERDRAVFEVILSDQLRRASLQEPADLRIRRRKAPASNYPLIEWFLGALERRLSRIAKARSTLGAIRGRQEALLGDVRCLDPGALGRFGARSADAIVTSPPYETALPYIDTQRLSLVALGALRAEEIATTERALIGARDISARERLEIERRIATNEDALPADVASLCRQLLDASRQPGNGFRRVNRPSLTYRYFNEMRDFFVGAMQILRPGGRLAMVVGTNRTVLAGREYVIDTPNLLASVAESCGYRCLDRRPMEAYPRYDLHQKNSIDAETLIVLGVN